MKSLQDWAEYYYSKGIYVWMPGGRPFDWSEWRSSYRQSLADVKAYNWKIAHDVYGVAGKRGIRVLSIKTNNADENTRDVFVKKVLELLNLDKYPWVISDTDSFSVIFDCIVTGNKIEDIFGNVSILYEGVFALPSSNSSVKFYFNGIPTIKPIQIRNKTLENCVEVLKDYMPHLK